MLGAFLFLSCDFVNLSYPLIFLYVKFSVITDIMRRSGMSESPWEMTLWFLTSARIFSFCCLFSFHVFHNFVMKFMILLDILNIFCRLLSNFAEL